LLSSKDFRANDKTSKTPGRLKGYFQPSPPQACKKRQDITPSRWSALTPELSHGLCLLISPVNIVSVCAHEEENSFPGGSTGQEGQKSLIYLVFKEDKSGCTHLDSG